jgi:hypothetical protein
MTLSIFAICAYALRDSEVIPTNYFELLEGEHGFPIFSNNINQSLRQNTN